MHLGHGICQGSCSGGHLAYVARWRVGGNIDGLVDRDLIAVNTRIGLCEFGLIALKFLDNLFAVVPFDDRINCLHGRHRASHNTRNCAVGWRTGSNK